MGGGGDKRMRQYYLVTKPQLILLPDSVAKANENAPIESGFSVLTLALVDALIDAGRIK